MRTSKQWGSGGGKSSAENFSRKMQIAARRCGKLKNCDVKYNNMYRGVYGHQICSLLQVICIVILSLKTYYVPGYGYTPLLVGGIDECVLMPYINSL